MYKFLATIMVAFQKFNGMFSDDEPYEPWMDYRKWESTRIRKHVV